MERSCSKNCDLQFTRQSFWETVQTHIYLSATDPDLSRFAGRGGKLLLWHGWNDQHIAPQSTLANYKAARETMGDRPVERFTRLYLFPGLAHCSGGLGPNTNPHGALQDHCLQGGERHRHPHPAGVPVPDGRPLRLDW